jgi:predicted translin family RNA/ssDNA-binding protein
MADKDLPQEDLHQELARLQRELENTDSADERSVQLLRELKEDIQDILDRSTSTTAGDKPDLFDRLQESIERFEATHPGLTNSAHSVMALLSNMGI